MDRLRLPRRTDAVFPEAAGPTDADWPSRSSYFGIVDLAGFPKDRFYLYQSQWTAKPMVHVLPHWNWAGRKAEPIPVMVLHQCRRGGIAAERQIAGTEKALGGTGGTTGGSERERQTRSSDPNTGLMWQVPYQPGTLKAIAYQDEKQVATDEIRTAGAPARVGPDAGPHHDSRPMATTSRS